MRNFMICCLLSFLFSFSAAAQDPCAALTGEALEKCRKEEVVPAETAPVSPTGSVNSQSLNSESAIPPSVLPPSVLVAPADNAAPAPAPAAQPNSAAPNTPAPVPAAASAPPASPSAPAAAPAPAPTAQPNTAAPNKPAPASAPAPAASSPALVAPTAAPTPATTQAAPASPTPSSVPVLIQNAPATAAPAAAVKPDQITFFGRHTESFTLSAQNGAQLAAAVCRKGRNNGVYTGYTTDNTPQKNEKWIEIKCSGHKVQGLWKEHYFYDENATYDRSIYYYDAKGKLVTRENYREGNLIGADGSVIKPRKDTPREAKATGEKSVEPKAAEDKVGIPTSQGKESAKAGDNKSLVPPPPAPVDSTVTQDPSKTQSYTIDLKKGKK